MDWTIVPLKTPSRMRGHSPTGCHTNSLPRERYLLRGSCQHGVPRSRKIWVRWNPVLQRCRKESDAQGKGNCLLSHSEIHGAGTGSPQCVRWKEHRSPDRVPESVRMGWKREKVRDSTASISATNPQMLKLLGLTQRTQDQPHTEQRHTPAE